MREDPRYEDRQYAYFIPEYSDLRKWTGKEPTKFKVSVNTMKPGYVVWSNEELWLCIGIEDMGTRGKDIRWIYYDILGQPIQIQQIFSKSNGHLWDCSAYDLDSKPQDDYCKHCHIPLEWTMMAMKCPKCWWQP